MRPHLCLYRDKRATLSGPGTEERCCTGTGCTGRTSAAGEAHYAVRIPPDETIWTVGAHKLRVLDVVPVEEEDSPYNGLLRVAPV